ncbi:MAG: hypothetical protein Q8L75_16820, partial [Acidobacteriota bacterium]|nr:hypothetical protein [Acidobacteriota bacterium]
MNRWSAALALIMALGLATFGVTRGTGAVGGSDSSCYGLMAEAFGTGQWQPASALAVEAPWPDASRTLAPGGFIPSPVRPDAASPVCAPGFSVLMAPFYAIGGRDAIFAVTPIAAFVLVWCAFVLANRLAGGLAGVSAAALTASSPIVLFQTVQPMNDIATAALWLAALAVATVRLKPDATLMPEPDVVSGLSRTGSDVASGFSRTSLLAGVLIGIAILVRPNLAPLAVIVAAMQWRPGQPIPWRSTGLMVAGALPGVAAWLWLNQVLYGSPVGSGYGRLDQLFSLSNVASNLSSYGRAFYQTQTVFPVIALAAPFLLAGESRRVALWLLAAAAVVFGIYLPYRPHPEWWYLRFLIPAIVLLLVVACSVAVRVADGARMRGVVAIGTVMLALLGLRVAGARDVLALQALEGRYRETANLVAERLPPNAVLIAVWQSGSVRFHAGREAVLWDSLEPAWLDRAVQWLSANGRVPYILVERREEAEFRDRFRGHADIGSLDWPPRFNIGGQARIFDPADRVRYLAGEEYPTENTRPARR